MASELERLRAQQSRAVMERIGPLLDAWEAIPNDVKGDFEDGATSFCRQMRLLYKAVDGGGK